MPLSAFIYQPCSFDVEYIYIHVPRACVCARRTSTVNNSQTNKGDWAAPPGGRTIANLCFSFHSTPPPGPPASPVPPPPARLRARNYPSISIFQSKCRFSRSRAEFPPAPAIKEGRDFNAAAHNLSACRSLSRLFPSWKGTSQNRPLLLAISKRAWPAPSPRNMAQICLWRCLIYILHCSPFSLGYSSLNQFQHESKPAFRDFSSL